MNFIESLKNAWVTNNSLLCVGLDPDLKKIPAAIRGKDRAILEFCTGIVDATADLVCAFKPQIAYFAAHQAEEQLKELIHYIHAAYPQIPVILDAKRGDIGNTAEQYAIEAFERYRADAVTLSPYMGKDSIDPYLAYPEKGIILLCRTSNAGGSDLQALEVTVNGQRMKLYEHVARMIASQWNTNGQCMLVAGATYTEELSSIRNIVGDMPLLVPGIGAQGGDVEATIRAGRSSDGTGLVINSSRAILYAGGDDAVKYAQKARDVALQTRDAINAYR